MKNSNKKKIVPYFLMLVVIFLTSCSKYTGIKTPLYDGKPIKSNEVAIETYRTSAEVIDAEKEFYIRHPFSEDILQKSLDYSNEEPFLLEEGRYTIGEDLPAGRATLLGNESSFSTENYDVHVGNLIVRDRAGEIYFENLFHSEYGQLTTQFDLIPGHEITIIGKEPEITVFYEDSLPTDPYVLMDLPVTIENFEPIDKKRPIENLENGKFLYLTAGIYEVGVHLKAGEYEISDLVAPHNTEMYIFNESSTPRVIELLLDTPIESEEIQDAEDKKVAKENVSAKVQLVAGEKIYLSLVKQLELVMLN